MDKKRGTSLSARFGFLNAVKFLSTACTCSRSIEPGNELRIVSELMVPGGSISYCLVSVRSGKVIDFAGIELQTLDTTGTVWPERQRFLQSHGIPVRTSDADSNKKFGMNWKMTAKTILMQLHHKVQTFEHLSKHLVLVTQDCLIEYMQRGFSFEHLQAARLGDPMHFHAYQLVAEVRATKSSSPSAGVRIPTALHSALG